MAKLNGFIHMQAHDMVFVITAVPICFWQNDNQSTISVTAGSLEDAKDLAVRHHIFTEEKGCYYTISPNEPQSEGYGDSRI